MQMNIKFNVKEHDKLIGVNCEPDPVWTGFFNAGESDARRLVHCSGTAHELTEPLFGPAGGVPVFARCRLSFKVMLI